MRKYILDGIQLDHAAIEILKKSDLNDRKFLNKMLDMVYTTDELSESNAKGQMSHGVSHKPLNQKRLRFVESK